MTDMQNLHCVMAGSGHPYAVLTKSRQKIARALHDGQPLMAIADNSHLSRSALVDELEILVSASLVQKRGGEYTPAFFIADAVEAERVKKHAEGVGAAMGEHLSRNWERLTAVYKRMNESKRQSFERRAFILVGAQTLDVDLLAVLEDDGILMPPPPPRPSPGHPDAAYYFWMVEGSVDNLGIYGKNNWNLPYPGWNFFTFGRHFIAELEHSFRFDREKQVNEARQRFASAHELAEGFQIPLFEKSDTALWSGASFEQARQLVGLYKQEEKSIRQLYASLRASRYTPYGFGEFFCWYDHLAFSCAIDLLEVKGCMLIPEQRFDWAFWEDAG